MKLSECGYPIAGVLFRITRDMQDSWKKEVGCACSRLVLVLLLMAAFLRVAAANAQQNDKSSAVQKTTPTFSEVDAGRLLAHLQQSLEADNQRGLLKLFDSRRMPNYAAFQDQVAEFFEKYEAFRLRYHLTQASSEDAVGIVLADVELELTPAGANVPTVRKTAQLRLVTAWDGKAWKILDWSPRSVLN
jgi:hypothetical protein